MAGHHTINISVTDIGTWFVDPDEFAALMNELGYQLQDDMIDDDWKREMLEALSVDGANFHSELCTPPKDES